MNQEPRNSQTNDDGRINFSEEVHQINSTALTKPRRSILMIDDEAMFAHRLSLKNDIRADLEQLIMPGEHINDSDLDSPVKVDMMKSTLSQRTFKKMGPGSLRASIFTLISSMIGVGFLTLPAIGIKSGYIAIIFFIIIGSSLSLFANLQLGVAYRVTMKNNYSLIVEQVLGRVWALLTLVFIFLYVFASSTTYFMFGALFAWATVSDMNLIENTDDNHLYFNIAFCSIAFILSFLGTIPKKMTALSIATLASSAIVLYTAVVIIVDFFTLRPWFIETNKEEVKFDALNLDINLFGGFCLCLFSCVNQFAVINIISEVDRPSHKRIRKVITLSAIFPVTIYLVIAVLGYLTYGNMTEPVIVDRARKPGSYDIPMTLARGRKIFFYNKKSVGCVSDYWNHCQIECQ